MHNTHTAPPTIAGWPPVSRRLGLGAISVAALALAGCATGTTAPAVAPETLANLAKAKVMALTAAPHQLFSFQAHEPGKTSAPKAVTGLPAGEMLVGIDYRVARGELYAVARSGQVYVLDTETAAARPVGKATANQAIQGGLVGVDFNPVADRIRVVSDSGQNLRLHPDTGALAATDPAVAYAAGDRHAGQPPALAGAGYTYNQQDAKVTTNYAIDKANGMLVTQGSREGAQPAVSPNTGQLFTVGPLTTGPLTEAQFDIADVNNLALAALSTAGRTPPRLYVLDLVSGRATEIGLVGKGGPLAGLAIEP